MVEEEFSGFKEKGRWDSLQAERKQPLGIGRFKFQKKVNREQKHRTRMKPDKSRKASPQNTREKAESESKDKETVRGIKEAHLKDLGTITRG